MLEKVCWTQKVVCSTVRMSFCQSSRGALLSQHQGKCSPRICPISYLTNCNCMRCVFSSMRLEDAKIASLQLEIVPPFVDGLIFGKQDFVAKFFLGDSFGRRARGTMGEEEFLWDLGRKNLALSAASWNGALVRIDSDWSNRLCLDIYPESNHAYLK